MIQVKITQKPNFKRNFTFKSSELSPIADMAKRGIQNRTESGLDTDNRSFKKYSAGYKKSGRVNLKVTGRMLNRISKKIKSNFLELRATDPKAKYHQYMGAGRGKVIRKWFGVDSRLQSKINKAFGNLFKKKVSGSVK